MKSIIIHQINLLNKEKIKSKVFPPDPNEFELKQKLFHEIETAIDELINEGSIKVNGSTGNKQRILKHDHQE